MSVLINAGLTADVEPRSPPDVAAFGEGGWFDDLRRHPGVGSRGAHLRRLVPLARQTEICDLQGFALDAVLLHRLRQQNWDTERERESEILNKQP